ncbi:acyltransferase [Mycobacterium sp. E2327]|uniref:condensation domain-containing protein n=1 Tax=Mycobacterium sp. E2327 TaxID=1834132 RepID=UPI0007FE2187|nr:condensation domain-containing protein [Mycobacterium sp. E2327]OBI13512.1 acyltransferase [Mycobacterium sp. E2327]
MVTLGNINGWQPGDGTVITWAASAAARAAARTARRSGLAPTYQRSRHLRAAFEAKKTGTALPRLMVVAWDVPGVCDIAAMTATINAHVRRHDAYHDWFEFDGGVIVRRMIEDPDVIGLVPTDFGHMDSEQIRAHALTTTPETLEWDCFTFGIVQHAEHFTFYASVDHLHMDGMSAGLIFFDINVMYEQLSQGGTDASEGPVLPGIASYRSYAARQREQVASLTESSPGIRDWIEFARDTRGDWPSFPLPVGDTEAGTKAGTKGTFLTVDLLDAAGTEAFEIACHAADARFSGGVLACAALAEHEFTGTETYHGFTAYDTRTPGVDSMTVGWFANLVPVTVPIGAATFAEATRAAQKSYDDAKHLADVPVERALALGARQGVTPPTARAMMVSFMDFRKIPAATLFEQANFGTYADNLSHGGINLWINRQNDKTTATISFPDNATARKSVHRYLAALTQAFAYAVNTTSDWVDAVAEHANSQQGIPVISI